MSDSPSMAVSVQSPDARCSQCLTSRARLVHVSSQTSIINQALTEEWAFWLGFSGD